MILNPRNHVSVASIALFLGGLLWIAAFWLPVFETEQRDIAGYWVFLTGWMGFVVFQFAWYANLLLLIAVILMYSAPVKATLCAALGLLIATQAFWFDVLPETTNSIAIIARGPGFWLWYGGIFLMSVGVFFCSDTDEASGVTEVSEIEAEPVSVPVSAENSVHSRAANNTVDPVADGGASSASVTAAVNTNMSEKREKSVQDTKTAAADNDNKNVSLVAQLESVRRTRQKMLLQQEKAKVLRAMEQEKKEELDEFIEHTLPATRAILSDALFSGTKKAGSQQLPAFLSRQDQVSAKV